MMFRELLGAQLRHVRLEQGRTLRDVSSSANVALGYLSELERGQKEASSELLAAICAALNLSLSVLLTRVCEAAAASENSGAVVHSLVVATENSDAVAA